MKRLSSSSELSLLYYSLALLGTLFFLFDDFLPDGLFDFEAFDGSYYGVLVLFYLADYSSGSEYSSSSSS